MSFLDQQHPDLHRLADAGQWDELLRLAADATTRDRVDAAHLVALEGPPALAVTAAELFLDHRGRPGPLWEIVARRPWRDLDRHLTNPRLRLLIAHARVLHGDDLRDVAGLASSSGPPLCLQPWERAGWDPERNLVDYDRTGSAGATIWNCPQQLTDPIVLSSGTAPPVEHHAVRLLTAVAPVARAAAFRATAWEAAATVAPAGITCSAGRLSMAEVYADLVNLAAGHSADTWSSGHAVGRIALWSALTAMAGRAAGDDSQLMGEFVAGLRLVGWMEETAERPPLYRMSLAMEDPVQGIAWVLVGCSDA